MPAPAAGALSLPSACWLVLAALVPGVAAIFAMIADVLPVVSKIFAAIAHVFSLVAQVFPMVVHVFHLVTDILTIVVHILHLVTDILTLVVHILRLVTADVPAKALRLLLEEPDLARIAPFGLELGDLRIEILQAGRLFGVVLRISLVLPGVADVFAFVPYVFSFVSAIFKLVANVFTSVLAIFKLVAQVFTAVPSVLPAVAEVFAMVPRVLDLVLRLPGLVDFLFLRFRRVLRVRGKHSAHRPAGEDSRSQGALNESPHDHFLRCMASTR